jgi:prepilin-type processing-associated H-X9-DG protein
MISTFPGHSALRRRAISLIEMLVVICIIAVLAALLLPVLGRVRQASLRAACASNLRQISELLNLYGNRNRGELPAFYSSAVGDPTARPVTAAGYVADDRGGVRLLVSKPIGLAGSDYAPNAQIFLCPADTLLAPNRPTDDDFGYDLRWGSIQEGGYKRAMSYDYLYVPADGSPRNLPALPPTPGPMRGYERHNLAQPHAATLAIFTDFIPLAKSAQFHGSDRNVLYLDGHVASMIARDPGFFGPPGIAALRALYDDLDAGGLRN